MATNRLGKGLGALLGTEVDIKGKDKRFVTIDIKKIKPNPNQARKTFDEAEIDDLANSVSQKGVIYPVLLTEKADGTYMIVAGERRFRAAKKVGLTEIPAIIENLSEREIMEVSLIENIQRVNLNPIEEARGIADLIEACGLSQEEAAKSLGKSRSDVTNSLRLLKLPPKVIAMVKEDKLSKGHAKCLLGVNNTETLIYLAEKTVKEGLSVRTLESLIANAKPVKKAEKPKKQMPIEIRAVEERLSDRLATKVTFSGNENKGSIKIDYYSKAELNGILDKILK